jgi:Kef-type K+ transport system membrane component KefB
MTWRESVSVGVLVNTRGLVELVILNVGLDLHILSPTLFSMMVLMALTTTLMTTPLIDRIFPSSS